MEQYIHCTKENAVAIVTINRPQALNALNPGVLRDLYDTMDQLDSDSSVKVVIITGAGEKAFVAGADIASMSTMTPEQALDFAKTGHRTMNRVAAMKKVTIAAINGFALGGGCELAMELLATGRQVDAGEAIGIGLVNRIVEPDELMISCLEMARQIAGNSTTAIALGKEAVCSGLETDLAHGLELEQKAFALSFATADQKEGMNAFLEKRHANFQQFITIGADTYVPIDSGSEFHP